MYVIHKIFKFFGLVDSLSSPKVSDLPQGKYPEEVLITIVEAVSKYSGITCEEIPLEHTLMGDMRLSPHDKSRMLGHVEVALEIHVFDGIHCLKDFTTMHMIRYYAKLWKRIAMPNKRR